MSTERKIELSVEDKELLASLARINTALKETKKNSEGVGEGVSSKSSALKSSLGALGGAAKIAGDVMKASFTAMGAALGGAVLGVQRVGAGLTTMQQGFKEVLLAAQAGGDGAASALSDLTNGLIETGDAAELLRKGRGIGLSDEQIGKVAKLGANFGLLSGKMDGVSSATKIFQSMMKGSSETLSEVDGRLFSIVQKDSAYINAKTQVAKQQALVNAVMKNYNGILEETGNVADSSLGRMIGLLQRVKEQTQGLITVVSGLGKVATGLLLPIGLGAASGFIGGPIAAALGLGVGVLVSGALTAGLLKIGGMLAGDGKDNGRARIDALKTIAEQFLASSGSIAFTGKGNAQIPLDVLKTAFNTEDEGVARKKGQAMFDQFVAGGRAVRGFGKGFEGGFEGTLNKEAAKELGDKLDMKKLVSPAEKMGAILGSIAGNIANLAIATAPAIKTILSSIFGIVNRIANPNAGKESYDALVREQGDKYVGQMSPAALAGEQAARIFGTSLIPERTTLVNQSNMQVDRLNELKVPAVAQVMADRVGAASTTKGLEDDRAVLAELKKMVAEQEKTNRLNSELVNKRL